MNRSPTKLFVPCAGLRREKLPRRLAPMLAVLGHMPARPAQYGFEIKWDGVRAVAFWDGLGLRLQGRNLHDMTIAYPEVQGLAEQLHQCSLILDGEMITPDEAGAPSFSLLQRRMHVRDTHAIARLARELPVHYVIFDLLHIDGYPVRELSCARRREILEELQLSGPAWRISPMAEGDGTPMLEAARQQALEGIIAKRLSASYHPGARSADWIKIKLVHREEFVVGGWIPGKGAKLGMMGSLQLGFYDVTPEEARRRGKPQRLLFAGGLGTGFDDRQRHELAQRLRALERMDCPFAEPPQSTRKAQIRYVQPELVVEIEHRGWTPDRQIRQGAFKGLRTDKDPRQVLRESMVGEEGSPWPGPCGAE